MDKDSKSAPTSLPSTGLLWIALFAAGAFFGHEGPWQGSRPASTDPRPYPYVATQDIDARLWQDPLSAVTRGRDDLAKRYPAKSPAAAGEAGAAGAGSSVPRTEESEHGPAALRADVAARACRTGVAPLVLAVMIPGGSYPDLVEGRRRARYAVLASLNAMGFAPEDPEHIGYLLPPASTRRGEARLPDFIAFEWMLGKQAADPEDREHPILVLWLDEDVFGRSPLKRVDALTAMLRTVPCSAALRAALLPEPPVPSASASAFDPPAPPPDPPAAFSSGATSAATTAPVTVEPKFVIVGPSYSSTLQSMLKAAVIERRVRDRERTAGNAATGATLAGGRAPSSTPPRPPFYAYGATSDNASLLRSLGSDIENTTLPIVFGNDDLQVFRTVGLDLDLAKSLKAELQRRGVDPPRHATCADRDADPAKVQHVVLISEWDTFYGRALPDVMTEQWRGAGCTADGVRTYVHRYSYLRGLDGQVPTGGAKPDAGAGTASGGAGDTGRSSDRGGKEKQIERPEGQSQLDYLRRLSSQLMALDADLQRTGAGSVVSVGVLGSDVFDKLLILQALRPQFQNVLFFTTDLDARLLHPLEQDWARNLIVASSFGLALHPALQRETPAFRGSYQTSVYLSTLIALYNALGRCHRSAGEDGLCIGQDRIDRWLARPRVFEVGRNLAFDFSDARPVACVDDDWAACPVVHPAGDAKFGMLQGHLFRTGVLLLATGLVVLAMTTGVARRWRRWQPGRWLQRRVLRARVGGGIGRTRLGRRWSRGPLGDWILRARPRPSPVDLLGRRHAAPASASPTRFDNCFVNWIAERRPLTVGSFLVGIALLALLVVFGERLWEALATYLTEGNDGEPISLLDGISIWPTEAIRLTAFVLSVAFTAWAWRLLSRNLSDVASQLHFRPTHMRMMARVRRDAAQWSRCRRIVGAFSYRLGDATGERIRPAVGLSWSAQIFWRKYLYKGTGLSRSFRVTLAVLLYFFASFVVIGYFGAPNTPFRGSVSSLWNGVILALSVGSMLFIVFFVVDATVFCHQIIRALKREVVEARVTGRETIWAESTLDHYSKRFGITEPSYLDAWVLIDFIALRTKVVAKLVYLPFIVISLMVLSRSRLFDNWTMPIGLIVVLGSSVAIIVGCAILLRESAESARDDVLKLLNDDLVKLKGVTGSAAAQIEVLIARVRAMRDGAFAPYSQQPLFRAMLLPLSTFGGSALLDWLTLSTI